MFRRLIVYLAVLLFPLCSAAQAVRVVDARNGSPVAFAHVKVMETGAKAARYFLSDEKGYIKYALSRPTAF